MIQNWRVPIKAQCIDRVNGNAIYWRDFWVKLYRNREIDYGEYHNSTRKLLPNQIKGYSACLAKTGEVFAYIMDMDRQQIECADVGIQLREKVEIWPEIQG